MAALKKKEEKPKKAKKVDNKVDDKPSESDERLRKCGDMVDSWFNYFNEHLERARNLLQFLYVDGWDQEVRRQREAAQRPTLTFNKIVPIVRSILGEQRINSAQLTVRACDKNTPQEWVDWRNDHLRYVAYKSESDVAYQTAFKNALEVGWGAIEVDIEYESRNTLNQCMLVKAIYDYQVAFFDPAATESNKSDGDFCGKYWIISKDDFKRKWPDVENPQSMGNTYYFQWQTDDTVTVCDLYYKDYFKKTLVRLSNGREMELSEAKELLDEQQDILDRMSEEELFNAELLGMEALEIVEQDTIMDFKIKKVRMVQNAILEESDWPGNILPIVYVEGDSTVVDGERIPLPFILEAVDSQKLVNYYGSEIAYSILNARREQFMATPQQTAGFEQIWRQPQNVQGVLYYNPDMRTGNQPPVQIAPPVFNAGLLQAQQDTTMQISQTLGRYEESRGEESNAQSGIAINSRKHASNLAVNVYDDNLNRAICQIGKIQMDLMPKLYKDQRDINLRDAEGKLSTITINKPKEGFNFGKDDEDFDIEMENPVDKGEYNIEVRVDGSYDAQRAEALETYLKFVQMYPPMAPLIPDLIAESSGLETANKLMERAKTILPPDIKAMEDGLPPPPPQPNPMQQMEQQKMQLEMKGMALKEQELQQNVMLKQAQIQIDEKKLFNENMKMQLDAQQYGLDAQVAETKAIADIQTTKVKADAEIKKSSINLATAHVVHHTKRADNIHKARMSATKANQQQRDNDK